MQGSFCTLSVRIARDMVLTAKIEQPPIASSPLFEAQIGISHPFLCMVLTQQMRKGAAGSGSRLQSLHAQEKE